jgi:hypothetical protein
MFDLESYSIAAAATWQVSQAGGLSFDYAGCPAGAVSFGVHGGPIAALFGS